MWRGIVGFIGSNPTLLYKFQNDFVKYIEKQNRPRNQKAQRTNLGTLLKKLTQERKTILNST
jgi:hypothetical protein